MRDENGLKEKSKGKTREGVDELLTMGDLQSHRKMFNLISNTFPDVTVRTSRRAGRWIFSYFSFKTTPEAHDRCPYLRASR